MDKSVIMEVRKRTGAGLSMCKKAAIENDGDIEKAVRWIGAQGAAIASSKGERSTGEGRIGSYVHSLNPKLCGIVDLACETDFVARTDAFICFADDLAKHIVAYKPIYLDEQSIPDGEKKDLMEGFLKKAEEEGKPEKVREMIADGRFKKWKAENCFMDQIWIKDPEEKMTVKQAVEAQVAVIKENIKVRGFVFMEAGGSVTVSQKI